MKTRFIAILAMFALPLAFSFSGCGNVCDDAADICGGGDGEGEDVECEGLVECVSQCVVDNDSCTSPETAECAAKC